MDVFEAYVPDHFFRLEVDPGGGQGIDLGLIVGEVENASCRSVCFGRIGYKAEYVSGLDGGEYDGGEDGEKGGRVDVALREPEGADVEDERNDEERHALAGSVQCVRFQSTATVYLACAWECRYER